MQVLYDLGILLFATVIRLTALFGNTKARLWISGRKNQENLIVNAQKNAGPGRYWIHCASLGEFEQGRPLIEKIKLKDPSAFIILSFYSPSGYEIRKNYPVADLVCYLPLDTGKNAIKFLDSTMPTTVIFVKYEFWHYYFKEVKKREIPLYVVSAIFRPGQIFFKWYGGFYRNILGNVKHFFVQDEDSSMLLEKTGFKNSTVTGDTRFDRVVEIANQKKQVIPVERFINGKRLIVAGSTWPEDEDILFPALKQLINKETKIVIAPHETDESRIQDLMKRASVYFDIGEITRYSDGDNTEEKKVFILDTIGLLSSVYYYCDIAWIGGGFGKGIHNVLEAAAYGKPVIFGPNYSKFREARELIGIQGAFSVSNKEEALEVFKNLLNDDIKFKESCRKASDYVNSHTGATDKIISFLQV